MFLAKKFRGWEEPVESNQVARLCHSDERWLVRNWRLWVLFGITHSPLCTTVECDIKAGTKPGPDAGSDHCLL